MTNDNSIMKFEEVMAYLDIGKSTLYTLLRNGDIQSFKIGKPWKIPRKLLRIMFRNLSAVNEIFTIPEETPKRQKMVILVTLCIHLKN